MERERCSTGARPGTRELRPGITGALARRERLNNGIFVPLLFAAVAVADVESEISEGRSPATLLLEEIGFGIVGG